MAYNKKWYVNNRDKAIAQSLKYQNKNKAIIKLKRKKYREKNREKLAKKGREDYKKNRSVWLPVRRQRMRDRRNLIIKHYGGKCACCGESKNEFLALDHTNGDGFQDRKKHPSINNQYLWIIKNNFPSKFRLLCHNCNQSKGYYGYCPHNKEFK